MIKSPALKPGDTVAIVSPSAGIASVTPERFERGLTRLQAAGYQVKVMPHARTRCGHRAGSYQEQAADINMAFADPEVQAIMATTGGYTSNGVLPYLDWDVIAANPKLFIGYSDITVLVTAFHVRTGLVTIQGPCLLPHFGEFPDMWDYTLAGFQSIVQGDTPTYRPSSEWAEEFLRWDREDHRPRKRIPNQGWQVMHPGRARAPLIGGNLAMLQALAGTRYFPATKGCLLFLEDDQEASLPWWEMRLNQMRSLGLFDGIAGLLIGRPELLQQPTRSFGFPELLQEQFGNDEFPIVYQVDYGHTEPMMTLPLGIEAELDTAAQTLRICEPAVV
ncbi:MAG TPA: LD-carboxypeptidase [Firmicutes bacterium]|nr:LD-carboxypeptidase [Bacillota bacterium]